jgi:hypothetical protein
MRTRFGKALVGAGKMGQGEVEVFKDEYLPNVEAATITFARWRSEQPAEHRKWTAYRDSVLAGNLPDPPLLSTRLGKTLMAAGHMAEGIEMAKVDLTVSTSGGTEYLTGTVTVTAVPRPAVQVTRVEVFIDSVRVVTDTSDPYTYSWDTTTVADGWHEIMAKAYFPRNQVTEKKLDVTVQNVVVEPPPPPIQDPPVNTALPVVSGTTTEGQRLYCSTGTWTNEPTNFSYQWIRCDAAGANGVAIIGATGSSYVLVADDATKTIRCAVTAFNGVGNSAVATSAQSAAIAGLTPAVPVNSDLPVISGTPTRGNVLAASTGSWTNAPTSYTYQWQRCDSAGANCVNIASATSNTYTLTSTDVTKRIRCGVIATNGSGAGTVAYSLATTAVVEPPAPPSTYTYRFATFNTATDKITGTLNRFNYPPYFWWVPGSAEPPNLAGATLWPDRGGLWPISTAYGPGIEIRCTDDMIYPGVLSYPSRLARLAIEPNKTAQFPTPLPFRGRTHIWEWTWMWPSAGNPGGWVSNALIEGFYMGAYSAAGPQAVFHHMYLKTSGSNLTYYMGRSNFTISNGQGWILSQSNITFPPDTYHHLKWEIKFSDASDGYMRAYTDTGSGYVKWAEFNGVTYPSSWGNVYTTSSRWSDEHTALDQPSADADLDGPQCRSANPDAAWFDRESDLFTCLKLQSQSSHLVGSSADER